MQAVRAEAGQAAQPAAARSFRCVATGNLFVISSSIATPPAQWRLLPIVTSSPSQNASDWEVLKISWPGVVATCRPTLARPMVGSGEGAVA